MQDTFQFFKQNKVRSFLTAFGVAWGIFILVLLLGVSGGLEKGILQLLNGYAQNSIWVYGGYSTAEEGNNKFTREIVFTLEDLAKIKANNPRSINYISPEVQVLENITWQGEVVSAQILAVYPDYFNINILDTKQGRLINNRDNQLGIKVAVIGSQVKDQVFGKTNAIGKELRIGDSFFKIIGVLGGGSVLSQSNQNAVFIPYQSAQICMNVNDEFSTFGLTLANNCSAIKSENQLRHYLGRLWGFDYDDANALYVFNFEQQVQSFNQLFKVLDTFFWFIGICLLLTGIIGVSNIMFVIVKERTSEIGIRKAIGAKQKEILMMILSESVLITLIAGLLGILLGAAVLSLLEYGAQQLLEEDFLIREADVNWSTIIGAFVILIVSGLFAGFLPAHQAAQIEPIDAIRKE